MVVGCGNSVRIIYQRASTLYVPIARPTIRLHYAYFEEIASRVDVARNIHEAILMILPGHVETIVSYANLSRRHGGLDAAIEVYKSQLDSSQCDIQAKAAFVAEWAKLLWKIKGNPDEARQVFQKNQHWYPESRPFWISYLTFELDQPTSAETEPTQYKRIKQVIHDIRTKSSLSVDVTKELLQIYMVYLQERGSKDSAREYMTLNREVNGPQSVQSIMKPETSKQSAGTAATGAENGITGAPKAEVADQGEAAYAKLYQQHTAQPAPSGGPVSTL